jgi:cbb3-type cytochrome oxidase subunit 3
MKGGWKTRIDNEDQMALFYLVVVTIGILWWAYK